MGKGRAHSEPLSNAHPLGPGSTRPIAPGRARAPPAGAAAAEGTGPAPPPPRLPPHPGSVPPLLRAALRVSAGRGCAQGQLVLMENAGDTSQPGEAAGEGGSGTSRPGRARPGPLSSLCRLEGLSLHGLIQSESTRGAVRGALMLFADSQQLQ